MMHSKGISNMKKTIAILLTISTLVFGCCSCSMGKSGRKKIVFEKDEFIEQYVSEKDKPMEIINERSDSKEVYFYRGEQKIYSEIYIPEGKGPFPVVVISGGMGSSLTANTPLAKKLVANDIVAVLFDPISMVSGSQSDGVFTNYSVMTQVADIESIISAISEESYIDTNQIYLWGYSIGGFPSTYVGCKNPDIIKGLILVEPSLFMNDDAREKYASIDDIPDIVKSGMYVGGAFYRDIYNFNIFDYMKDYNGNVIIYAGTKVSSIGAEMPELFVRADEQFPSCEVIPVEGADHSFAGGAINTVIDGTVDFVKNNK